MPKGGAVGSELLDQEKFGINQFEQVNYQQALEGELSRTIETIGPVKGRAYIWQCRNRLYSSVNKIPFCIGDGKSVTGALVKNAMRHCASGFQRRCWSAAGNVTLVDQGGHLLTQSIPAGAILA